MTHALLLLFGPQRSSYTPAALNALRNELKSNESLLPLVYALKDLPRLYRELATALQPFRFTAARHAVDSLLLACLSYDSSTLLPNCNAFLTPLSFIADIVSVKGYGKTSGCPLSFSGAIGLCTGSLSAAVYTLAERRPDCFGDYTATALRLALLAGIIVDAVNSAYGPENEAASIAVRCDSTNRLFLKGLLAKFPQAYIAVSVDESRFTITLPRCLKEPFQAQLDEHGVVSNSVALSGYFHSARNGPLLACALDYCKQSGDLRFPQDREPILPLWVDTNIEPLPPVDLHASLLSSILIRQAQWGSVLQSASEKLSLAKEGTIFLVGEPKILPRYLLQSVAAEVTPAVSINISSSESGECPPVAYRQYREDDIAVVGMACRFPNAPSVHEFWRLLCSGGSSHTKIPKSRFTASSNSWANLCADVDAFDNTFFNFTGREASFMDPQQRMPRIGTVSSSNSADVGCYLGVGAVDYSDNLNSHESSAFSASGTLRAFIAGRISQHLGFTGPSICYDTACSSSLVAIHAASNALRFGECKVALAGGVNVITSPFLHRNLDKAGFLSKSGPCKSFDALADGYCRGEGAGLVVLKKISTALRDGDEIHAIIAGSAVNQGHNSTPITVPSSNSLVKLYSQASTMAGLKPADVGYVEAHGTGTPVGDPIEMQSIRNFFGGNYRAENLLVGSVKSNIGHLESASGIAGLIKSILMLRYRTVPMQANFATLNPKIKPLNEDRLEIPLATRPWDGSAVCVNNYGAASSNAALIVCRAATQDDLLPSAPKQTLDVPHASVSYPIVISASSEAGLKRNCEALAQWLRANFDVAEDRYSLASLAFQINHRSDISLAYRLAATVSSKDELQMLLTSNISSPLGQGLTYRSVQVPLVLCFGGQSKKFVGLSKSMYDKCDIFRNHLNDVDRRSQEIGGPTIFPHIYKAEPFEDVVLLQTMLFAIQFACARSWIDCGAPVQALIGHSFGQLTALCVGGSLDLRSAMTLIHGRATLIKKYWGKDTGSMLAVQCTLMLASKLVADNNGEIEIACYNSSTSFVFAGSTDSISDLPRQLKAMGVQPQVKTKALDVTHAFHTKLADPMMLELAALSEKLHFSKPNIHIEPCTEAEDKEFLTPKGVVDHTRKPVFFHIAVQRLVSRHGPCLWLDAGASSDMASLTCRAIESSDRTHHKFHGVDLTNDNAWSSLSNVTSKIWNAGSYSHFWPFHRSQRKAYISYDLPPFQFEKRRHWREFRETLRSRVDEIDQTSSAPELISLVSYIRPETHDETLVEFTIDTRASAFAQYLSGHSLNGTSVCPASLYISLAMRAAEIARKPFDSSRVTVSVKNLQIHAPMTLKPDQYVTLSLNASDANPTKWSFSFASYSQTDFSKRKMHAKGTAIIHSERDHDVGEEEEEEMLENIRIRLLDEKLAESTIEGTFIYQMFSAFVQYSDFYQGVRSISASANEAAGLIKLPESKLVRDASDSWAPLVLDNMLQVAGLHANCLSLSNAQEVYMCIGIGSIALDRTVSDRTSGPWKVACTSTTGENELTYNMALYKPGMSKAVAVLKGVHFLRVKTVSLTKSLALATTLATHETRKTAEVRSSSVHADLKRNGTTRGTSTQQERVRAYSGITAQKARSIISSLTEISESLILDQSPLGDVGIDSLMMIETLRELEDGFQMQIDMHDLQDLETFGALCAYIQARQEQSEGSTTSREATNAVYRNPNLKNPNGIATGRTSELDVQVKSVEEFTQGQVRSSMDMHDSASDWGALKAFAHPCSSFDKMANQALLSGFDLKVLSDQTTLVHAYIVDAFEASGCILTTMIRGSEVKAPSHLPKHGKLVERLLQILQEAGWISFEQDSWRRTAQPILFHHPPGVMLEELIYRFPQHAVEHRLLGLTGPHLADCLSGVKEGTHLMFGNQTTRSLVESVYTTAPMFDAATKVLQESISIAAAAHVEKETVPLQIIEIGAGTGATTRAVIETLENLGVAYRYRFTDISPSLVAAAKSKGFKGTSMTYQVLDIENEPTSNFKRQFDIVISTNAIHATRNLSNAVRNIRKLFRADGLLFLVELTRRLAWFDISFGLLEGWWHFNDHRKHVLVSKDYWQKTLLRAGFSNVVWSTGASSESDIIRVLIASVGVDTIWPSEAPVKTSTPLPSMETVQFDQVGQIPLYADIWYPSQEAPPGTKHPIAILVHGGGNVLLSRRDLRPAQREILISGGFIAVSPDHRLCPEIDVISGPIRDVTTALGWCRNVLPSITLRRKDIHPDRERVVVVGWSTGGHLALSTGWASIPRGIQPPNAILAFYCPVDYESEFWKKTQYIWGLGPGDKARTYDLWDAVRETALTGYNVSEQRTPGGWVQTNDIRAKMAMHMNWSAQTLPILLGAMTSATKKSRPSFAQHIDSNTLFPQPDLVRVQEISPLAHARAGTFVTPVFLLQGMADDFVEWQTTQAFHEELNRKGIEAHIELVAGAPHMFDIFRAKTDYRVDQCLADAYKFLFKKVGLDAKSE